MNTKNKIIAILMAGIVAMAIGVPMAMGDSATQSATVTTVYTVELDPDSWTFEAAGPNQIAVVSTQNPAGAVPTCTITNPSSNNIEINVDLYASAFSDGSGHSFLPGTYEKIVIRANGSTDTIDWGTVTKKVDDTSGDNDITSLGIGVTKDTYFQLTMGSSTQYAGVYSSTFSAVSSAV